MARAVAVWVWLPCAVWAQLDVETPYDPNAGSVRVGTTEVRSALDFLNLDAPLLNRVPDVRLTFDTTAGLPTSAADAEGRVRGLEFRLPVDGDIWMGYEDTANPYAPRRATVTIKHEF
jgi:hypothetical protein